VAVAGAVAVVVVVVVVHRQWQVQSQICGRYTGMMLVRLLILVAVLNFHRLLLPSFLPLLLLRGEGALLIRWDQNVTCTRHNHPPCTVLVFDQKCALEDAMGFPHLLA
jgi:hypothetical protein